MNIAIFASGAGSNAKVIINKLPSYKLYNKTAANIALILTNNKQAGVLNIAAAHKVPTEIITLKEKSTAEVEISYLNILKKYKIDFIVLAGYLKKIPAAIIQAYPQKIINIHPALLPKYGGAGMYGMHVHQAVLAAGDKQTGITIHLVDEVYDNGKILFQTTVDINENDSPQDVATKVLYLEHLWYSPTIANAINKIL